MFRARIALNRKVATFPSAATTMPRQLRITRVAAGTDCIVCASTSPTTQTVWQAQLILVAPSVLILAHVRDLWARIRYSNDSVQLSTSSRRNVDCRTSLTGILRHNFDLMSLPICPVVMALRYGKAEGIHKFARYNSDFLVIDLRATDGKSAGVCPAEFVGWPVDA